MKPRWLGPGLAVAALVVAAAVIAVPGSAAPGVPAAAPSPTPSSDAESIRIDDVRPLDPSPGTSIRLTYDSESDALPRFRIADRDAAVLHRGDGRVVLRVPVDTPLGFATLTVGEGARSQKVLLRVKPVQRRKLIRNILGGLALFLLGLRSIGQGLRRSVGPRDRGLLAGATGSAPRAVGFGALMGGLTQSTTSAAAIFIGMRQAHMLSARASIWVIVGAYLGTVVTASLLPLAATREALLVVALGTPFLMFARRRRIKGIGAAVVGFGMLALGLRFIQTGFQPLIGDPELVVYIKLLTGHGMLGGFVSAAVGAVLAAALQGPGPVFALVMGVAQSSGIIGLDTALSVLAGAALGSSVGVLVLAIPYGQAASRLSKGFFWFGVCALLLQVVALPLWVSIADALIAGDPNEIAHGKKILLPRMAAHLAAGFGVAQLGVLAVFALLARAWGALADARGQDASARTSVPADAALAIGPELAQVLDTCGRALASSMQTARTHEAAPRSETDDAVQDSQQRLERLTLALAGEGADPTTDPGDHDRRVASLAIAHLHTAVVSLRDTAERAVADNLELLPEIDEAATEVEQLLSTGLAGAAASLRGALPETLDSVQAREIRINSIESSIRKQLFARPRADTAAVFMGSQLLAALENVGNHLFRVSSALAATPDDFI